MCYTRRAASNPIGPVSPRDCARRRALAASTSSTPKDRGDLRESVRLRESRGNTRADNLQLPPAKPTSPVAIQSRGNSPGPRKRFVCLSCTPGRGTLQNGLRRSMSASTQRTSAESRNRSIEGESHFQTQAEMDERQPKQEYTQTGINTPISSVRTVWISVGSSGQRTRSAGSSAVTSKRFGADSGAGTPENTATAERADAADSVGSIPRSNNSGKREDLELRSTTRLKRVTRVSGSLLSGPARRGRRRQTEEDAQAHSEEPLTAAAQDPESQKTQDLEPAAIDQPAMAFSASKLRNPTALGSSLQTKHPIPAAIGKEASPVRLFDMHAKRTASHSESPHHELIPLPEIPPVHAKKIQAPAPAGFRRASIKLLDKEHSKPATPLNRDTGLVAPQRAPISEKRALAVKSQNTPCRPVPSLPAPKMSVVDTVTATQSIKKRQFSRVNGRAYARIGFIGRGGSGKVYRVATERGTVFALKRVSLVHTDELTEKGLRREIELLQRLRDVGRVIQLIDYEICREKQLLCVVGIFAFRRHLPYSLSWRTRQLTRIAADGTWRTRLQLLPQEPPEWS